MKSTAWIPISQAVDYALIDDYDDAGVNRQRINNWVLRGYKKLNWNLLRRVRTAVLNINSNTMTARLPDDYMQWVEASIEDECGTTHIPYRSPVEYEEEEPGGCETCKSEGVCGEVTYTSEETTIANGKRTIVTRFDPRTGEYVIETTEPIVNYQVTPALIEFHVHRKSLCRLEQLPCGCIKKNDANYQAMKSCGCCQTALQYFAANTPGMNVGCGSIGFDIDEEARIIHVHAEGAIKLRLKYKANLPCRNGEVLVPEVAAEYLSAFALYMRDRRRKIPDVAKERSYLDMKRERSELRKNIFPIRSAIIKAAFNLE